MPKSTKENETSIEKNLEYIGLDLNNIPEILLDFKPIEFRPLQTYDDREHLIYKYIPINKIQILVTPTNRLIDVKTKYSLLGGLRRCLLELLNGLIVKKVMVLLNRKLEIKMFLFILLNWKKSA